MKVFVITSLIMCTVVSVILGCGKSRSEAQVEVDYAIAHAIYEKEKELYEQIEDAGIDEKLRIIEDYLKTELGMKEEDLTLYEVSSWSLQCSLMKTGEPVENERAKHCREIIKRLNQSKLYRKYEEQGSRQVKAKARLEEARKELAKFD